MTHQQLIDRINHEGKQAGDDKGKLRLHKTLTDVEKHLADTFDETRPKDTEPDPWIDLYFRYIAARKWLDS